MDAILILKEEHKQLSKLLNACADGNLSLVPNMCLALRLHSAAVEGIFYSALSSHVEDIQQAIAELLEVHHVMESLTAELQDVDPAELAYEAKARVLIKLARMHIDEEELLFPKIRRALGRKRLKQIGAEVRAFETRIAPWLEAAM